MRIERVIFLIALVALQLPMLRSNSQAAETTISQLDRATPIDAYGDYVGTAFIGYLAWSEYDQANQNYRLALWNGVEIMYPLIAPRSAPFDVDLGPDTDSRPVAVYSRCEQSCRIYRLDIESGVEQPLAVPHEEGTSHSQPSIWRQKVAYVNKTGGEGVTGGSSTLYLVDTEENVQRQLFTTGRMRCRSNKAGSRTCRAFEINSPEITRNRLAFVKRTVEGKSGQSAANDSFSPTRESVIFSDLRGSRGKLVTLSSVEITGAGPSRFIGGVSLAKGSVLFLKSCTGSSGCGKQFEICRRLFHPNRLNCLRAPWGAISYTRSEYQSFYVQGTDIAGALCKDRSCRIAESSQITPLRTGGHLRNESLSR